MALVVFFRGMNVGGHRKFRPSVLAGELRAYDVVNVGAAGTLVVRKPGSRPAFVTALRRRLPFDATIAVCDGRDLLRLERAGPFASAPPPADRVRFVSILAKSTPCQSSLPIAIPEAANCFVRVDGVDGQFVFGEYRRHMKTIGCLGQLDALFGAPATTRSWSTILSVLRILKA